MSAIGSLPEQDPDVASELPKAQLSIVPPARRKGPHRALTPNPAMADPLLTAEDVSRRLNMSVDWVYDHCSRKLPRLPFVRIGDGGLRFRASAIEAFIDERERLSAQRSKRR